MTRRDPNDAWVECTCGSRHWGLGGAAGLALVDRATGTVALQLRSAASHQGGSWALPGGAIGTGESPLAGALREAQEEAAIASDAVRPRFARVLDHEVWRYTTVVADVVGERPVLLPLDGESADLAWVELDAVDRLPLHPAFAQAWPALRTLATTRAELLVDVANVLGSRPDGWWRDRPGATTHLLATLADAGPLPADWFGLDAGEAWPDVVAVLEGAARAATPPPPPPAPGTLGVSVVPASGSGDDEIVRLAAASPSEALAVATADRELRSRLPERARVVGPETLRRHLDQAPRPRHLPA
ncbi:NUDIX hydrolase [Serinibacter arcticus]|uniref:NUDIX hydrolase n=1 Tax=Serinibacter arcticus TaxID=1655435 RepID=UPI001F33F4A2|nr:NUDIX hydrolase [Serinibacter arcticus]